MSGLPDGIRSIESIEDTGPLAALATEVDLDDLALEMAAQEWDEYGNPTTGRDWRWGYDRPTNISGSSCHNGEARVGWFRRIPAVRGNCLCGGGHAWDLTEASTTEKPEGNKARGAFLGVWFA